MKEKWIHLLVQIKVDISESTWIVWQNAMVREHIRKCNTIENIHDKKVWLLVLSAKQVG